MTGHDAVVATINSVRETFLRGVAELPRLASFHSLIEASPEGRRPFDRIAAAAQDPRIAEPCDGTITCALIGSSAHGKTTVLDELFPRLAKRGWLVTDVTDTTSQSLAIRYRSEGSPDVDEVTVRSWDARQIKELLHHVDVREQNERDGIKVTFHDGHAVVDGEDASLPKADVAQFRFPRRVELWPFPRPWQVPLDRRGDPGFIRALTVKEQSAVMRTDPLIEIDGRSWDPLQLRAVVQEVALTDPFDRIAALGRRGREAVARLTFVDTPGLATPGSVKDEVLRHFLEHKSTHIALELWRADALDIVVHLVLCGRSSDFAALWKQIERTCDDPDLDGLEDRLILAVNGMNRYFTDPNIKEKYEDPEVARRAGDQFATTLESNILQNMSPRGRTRPARVCFLDSERIVETLTGTSYEQAYARYRSVMEQWAEPGGPGYATLERLGLVESFRENIDALCDPEDRGQGFLIRALLDLVEERGPALLLRKVLVRTGLLGHLRDVLELLDANYDQDGALNRAAVREALRSCLAFLDPQHLDTIERFAAEELDAEIDGIVESVGGREYPEDWVPRCWQAMCALVLRRIEEQTRAAAPVLAEFRRQFANRTAAWCERFGYSSARLLSPARGYANSRELVTWCLKLHAREILWQLLDDDDGEAATFEQDAADRAAVVAIRDALEGALADAERACRTHGVVT